MGVLAKAQRRAVRARIQAPVLAKPESCAKCLKYKPLSLVTGRCMRIEAFFIFTKAMFSCEQFFALHEERKEA